MPTEFRFDDLDLREEPARGDSHDVLACTGYTNTCTATARCTKLCCTCHTG